MIFELRQYWAKPGRRDALVELMEHRILPMQSAGGVRVVASFVDAADPDAYAWIRSWESDDERERVSAVVYGSAAWTEELLPAVRELMDRERTVVTMLTPTPGSPLQ